jgi:hypothetical protein
MSISSCSLDSMRAVACATGGIEIALASLRPASASLLAQRALLRRTDTKFVVPLHALPELICAMAPHYAVLSTGGGCGSPYRTLYLDTADRQCFHDHRRGRRLRHKIRIRHYDDRKLSFLEVKSRRSELVTDKHRIELSYGDGRLKHSDSDFIESRTGLRGFALRPQLWIDYQRVTLLGLAFEERCTIDFSLTVASADRGHQSSVFDDLVLLELKQPTSDPSSPMIRALRAARLRPRSLSKYVVAVTALFPQERANRLRIDLRRVLGAVR